MNRFRLNHKAFVLILFGTNFIIGCSLSDPRRIENVFVAPSISLLGLKSGKVTYIIDQKFEINNSDTLRKIYKGNHLFFDGFSRVIETNYKVLMKCSKCIEEYHSDANVLTDNSISDDNIQKMDLLFQSISTKYLINIVDIEIKKGSAFGESRVPHTVKIGGTSEFYSNDDYYTTLTAIINIQIWDVEKRELVMEFTSQGTDGDCEENEESTESALSESIKNAIYTIQNKL